MSLQSCLQLLPVASTEIVSPTQLVVLPIGCRADLFFELVLNFVKRALYSLQWLIQRSYVVERPFISLNDLAGRTLL